MRDYRLLFFWILVLGCWQASAAPSTTTTFETKPFSGESDPVLESTDASLANSSPTFFLNVSAGFAGGNYLEKDEYIQGSFFALRYMPVKFEELPVLDYAIEVYEQKLLGIAVGKRWYCCEEYEEFLPYLRVSGNIILESAGELASIAEIRRWRARASGGIGNKMSLEMGFGLAITGTDLFAQLGYNFEF